MVLGFVGSDDDARLGKLRSVNREMSQPSAKMGRMSTKRR